MDDIFGKLPFVVVYIDDILIFSKNRKEQMKHICTVLEILKKNGLIVKPEKCTWAQSSVEFLGHQVSAKGMSPLPAKVHAITKFPTPTTIKK